MTKKEKIQKILISDINFTTQNNAYCFLPGNRMPHRTAGEGLLGKIQDMIKKHGELYYFLLR
ncbi:MAG: hypothetical protein KAQ81_05165, partial [Deltaproteobacteria bacterium]|nr:hypothetical protein [Deltaproteobacteria bacterium]